MTAFNRKNTRSAVFSPIKTKATATTRTYNGAPGFERDAKSDVFLLAAGSFFGQDAFYESGNEQADRFRALMAVNTAQDPAWTAQFLAWLRGEGNIRTGAIVGAVEYARTLQEIVKAAGEPAPLHEDITARAVVRSVLQRADEPGEMLAYYTSRYGRSVPIAIKRGIADAIVGHKVPRPLYTEYTALKYDTPSHGFRFADVLELVHPTGEHPEVKGTKTATLFKWLVDRRHDRVDFIPGDLTMVQRNAALRDSSHDPSRILRDPSILEGSGFTWEDALSLWGSKLNKAKLWEAMIPSMGYMARLRNLRNFDESGVSDSVALKLAADLADPNMVATSRQLPMRFLSAYRAAPSLRWGYALETALDHSLQNVPELKGRTLILVDTSGSMDSPFSKDGSLMRWDAATVFGLALARRAESADLVSFSSGYWGGTAERASKVFPMTQGESLLKSLDRWQNHGYFIGGGTDTAGAVQRHYRNHDRVVILTDEQADYHGNRDVTATVPKDRMVYTFNLAGYSRGHAPSGTGTRHTFGGLTDAAFRLIPLIERGRNADWPWS
jgi:hypothetical protein